MNSYITPGNYRCVTNASLATLSNCPVDNAFSLKVSTPIGSPNYIVQEYIDLAGRQAIRAYSAYEKTWTEKKSVVKDDLACGTTTIKAGSGTLDITFPKAFDDVPVVVATIQGLSKDVFIAAKVYNISKSKFTVTVVLFDNGSIVSPSYETTVEWIAMRKA